MLNNIFTNTNNIQQALEVSSVSYKSAIDVNTLKELLEELTSLEDIYKTLFLKLCEIYHENKTQYESLLKMYSYNYRDTVLIIELENLKKSAKNFLNKMG